MTGFFIAFGSGFLAFIILDFLWDTWKRRKK